MLSVFEILRVQSLASGKIGFGTSGGIHVPKDGRGESELKILPVTIHRRTT